MQISRAISAGKTMGKSRNNELRKDYLWPGQLLEQLSVAAEQFNVE